MFNNNHKGLMPFVNRNLENVDVSKCKGVNQSMHTWDKTIDIQAKTFLFELIYVDVSHLNRMQKCKWLCAETISPISRIEPMSCYLH